MSHFGVYIASIAKRGPCFLEYQETQDLVTEYRCLSRSRKKRKKERKTKEPKAQPYAPYALVSIGTSGVALV